MSFDLVIWKRSATTKTAMLSACYAAIIEDRDHQAMEGFDENALLSSFETVFGERHSDYFGADIDECPFLYSVGRGAFGNWMICHLNWSTYVETTQKIVQIALQNDLLVYDPQHETVWGNKRPVKPMKTPRV
jgi:hypothetical protein